MALQETHLFEDKLALIRCLPELNELRTKGELLDTSIELQGNVTLHAHKVVLVSRIPTLLRDYLSGMQTKEQVVVLRWPHVSSEVARPLLDYVYTGQLSVNEANAASLIVLSQQLEMPQVEDWAVSFMAARLNPESIAKYWDLARLMNNDRLRDACLQHIKTTFETIIATDFFIEMPSDTVLSLLRADDLVVVREETAFEAIRRWVSPVGEVDQTRLVHVATMLKEVRWNQINPEFRYRLLEEEGFWDMNVECSKLLGRINIWIDGKSSSVDRQCPFNDKARKPLGGICIITRPSGRRKLVLNRYDVDENTLEELPASETDEEGAAFVAIGDCIFAIGGSWDYGFSMRIDKFDTKECQWRECAPLNRGYNLSAAAVVPVGGECVVLVCGGLDKSWETLDTCELYSPREDRCYLLPNLTEGRHSSVAVSLPDGRVFIIGGRTSGNGTLSSVLACHLREPADWQGRTVSSDVFWKTVAPIIFPRHEYTAVAFRDTIFVGGTGQGIAIEVFAPPDKQRPLGQWTRLINVALKDLSVCLAVWHGRLFSFCSDDKSGFLVLEVIPSSSRPTEARNKQDWWTWTDHGKVEISKTHIKKALTLG